MTHPDTTQHSPESALPWAVTDPATDGDDMEARRIHIRSHPVDALTALATAHGIQTAEDIAQAQLADTYELLFAASTLETQVDIRSIIVNMETLTTASLAGRLLDRALELRRAGADFGQNNHAITRHEDRAVTLASSLQDFWSKLQQLGQWRKMDLYEVSARYGEWRKQFIIRRQRERAFSYLEEDGIVPAINFVPEGFHNISVVIEHGTVEYRSVDDLLRDMHRYFLPRTEDVDTGTIDPALIGRVNPKGDIAIMERLEQEIRTWAAGQDEHYQDSASVDQDDPYASSGGLFTGHIIGITRSRDGDLYLSLKGGRMTHRPEQPTQQIDDFAGYLGRYITYGGDITITYTGEPPATIDVSSPEEAVAVDLPFEPVVRQLKDLLSLDAKTAQRIRNVIITNPDQAADAKVQHEDMTIGIALEHISQQAHLSADGHKLEGYATIPADRYEGARYFALPRIVVRLQNKRPGRQANLGSTLHAIDTITRKRPAQRYVHGSVGGNGLFNPHPEA